MATTGHQIADQRGAITRAGSSWESRLWHLLTRRGFASALAVGLVAIAMLLGSITYMVLTGLTPVSPSRGLVIALLIANLAVVLVLLALIVWRVARLILARVTGTAGAKLHSRLVTMFAIVAVMPAIIVAVFAAVTLNRGLDSWFSERTRVIIGNAETVAEAYLREHHHVLRSDALLMASDLDNAIRRFGRGAQQVQRAFTAQAALRSINVAHLISADGEILLSVSFDAAPKLGQPTPEQIELAQKGVVVLETMEDGNNIRALVKLSSLEDTYLYIARFVDARVLEHLRQTKAAVSEYESLEGRRFTVQITFALFYAAVALVVLLAAIWLGLWAANRIVTPIGRLFTAAERVSEGDLTARVEVGDSGDEIDMLSRAFNRMTGQLEAQRNDLVEANHQLDQRRQFTEAVLSGVSAGVIGLDAEGRINHANRAALRFFGKQEQEIFGRYIHSIEPQMGEIVRIAQAHPQNSAHQQIVLQTSDQECTLNVRVTEEVSDSEARGYVLTFDDITELVRAQRTAAWADVARRIAHEIKNPLTPIQLSAERLRRKYGEEILNDPEVFRQCTDTIIRQVNDIGRMVDEFSSFARMPSAIMKPVELGEVVRQAVFLQRVAHPDIRYELKLPETGVIVECDRRLVSQALINILKNAAEAVRAKTAQSEEENSEVPDSQGRIDVALEAGDPVIITVTDSGCGLPQTDRLRLTEPYVTTRAKGTGLGLAIVNKVMEDHGGRLSLEDAPAHHGEPGGARIRLIFSRHASQENEAEQDGSHQAAVQEKPGQLNGPGGVQEVIDGV